MSDEVEPISGQQAREVLTAAIRAHLGDDWENEHDGWVMVTGHDFMARMTNGQKNVDFYVDLLGNTTVEEREIDPAQELGRMRALMFLFASLLAALVLARLADFL